ncbi:hypothetical protein RT723_16540 [Psychrosphaera aquimarina]|uniref:Uncharacterized protein n=1 Tax=Psychrosphaera aquimarina TaxID=2044854 RepID=A0ABU3R4F8_9GAMM|nr:hypothetical protein [Psychrosphaera aquimarina]MDU0114568.1 hypothetical protein [Psychrosphaera aquimarina]
MDIYKKQHIQKNIYDTGVLGLEIQAENGAMPAGHNGPYFDTELPTRNTAHWLMIFLHLFDTTQDSQWKCASEKCLNFLFSKEAKPHDITYFCREKR